MRFDRVITQRVIQPFFSQKFFEYTLYTISFTLPLVHAHWNAKIIILFTLIVIIKCGISTIWTEIKSNRFIWLFGSLFIADLIGLFYSHNLAYALRFIETHVAIIIFPIIILSARHLIDNKTIQNLVFALTGGILVVLIGYIFIIFDSYASGEFSLTQLISIRPSEYLPIINQTAINIHPTFLSLYIAFCLHFYFCGFYERGINFMTTAICCVLFLFLIWLNSRMGIIVFFTIGFIQTFLMVKKDKRIYILVLVVVLSVLIFVLPTTRERFIDAPLRALNLKMEVDAFDQQTWAFSFRVQITDCSISLLKDYRWLYGYGTGDFRERMYECYREKNYTWPLSRNMDQHCEYFAQLHRFGILGLGLFLFVLGWPMLYALRQQNYIYLSFLILICLSALSENILTSQKGVIFYSLFNSILLLRKTN